jgi:hypothetical protein
VWQVPVTKPLDEVVWQAWAEQGRARDRRSNRAHTKILKAVSIAALLAAAVLGSDFAPLQIVVRFLVVVSAMVILFQAIHAGHYVFAATFGALVVIYNPVAPAFGFSEDWQRAMLAASAVPFVVSLARDYSNGGRDNG